MTLPNQAADTKVFQRLQYERNAKSAGHILVAGLDEAGRGPLAGPVVAACVILPETITGLEGIHDSKKLTPVKRRDLFMRLHERALGIGVGIVDSHTIDRINILQATFLAMQRAYEGMDPKPDYLLVDGNCRPGWIQAGETIVQGDAHSLSIGAASIIAKVTRDRIMEDYGYLYPQWSFGRHKGYGTADHMAAIQKHGICELHRRTFLPISRLLQKQEP